MVSLRSLALAPDVKLSAEPSARQPNEPGSTMSDSAAIDVDNVGVDPDGMAVVLARLFVVLAGLGVLLGPNDKWFDHDAHRWDPIT
jgi:hypothetical protein